MIIIICAAIFLFWIAYILTQHKIEGFHTLLCLAENKCPMCGKKMLHIVFEPDGMHTVERCANRDYYSASYCESCSFSTDISPIEAKERTDFDE